MAAATRRKSFAGQRSHEDAKAANALFQAAGQASILINGGASTAILAFAAADKAVIRIAPLPLGAALACFAIGVVAGAVVIGFQAVSVQRYAVRWQNEALGRNEARVNEARTKGYAWGVRAQAAFVVSMLSFLCGALILAFSLGSFR